MKWARRIGFPMSAIGLVLCVPPMVGFSTAVLGQVGKLGGQIAFAIGWALLLGDLVFHLGVRSQKK